ncbi:DUF4956 domain-containing protein [Nocardioides insulae]|uniref:DUF4956 domain-containing protein n=1 Tax=Nocardioides insulae TaxID=394734 RepID=UPI00056D88C7|nr:DUF4956 domain-containing protein [Nocardioides insulae]
MSHPMVLADLVALAVLVFGLFWRRDGRRELVVAYLTVNIGVLGVTLALANSEIGAGLGLGLFGVLSIIRLRSEELAQREVAYYFAALALGLLGGLAITPDWLGFTLMAAVVLAVAVGDHPAVAPRTATQEILLDRAHADPVAMTAHVEELLGLDVRDISVIRLDLADDTTLVRVRYVPGTPRVAAAPTTLTEAAR